MSRVRIVGGEWKRRLVTFLDAPGLRPTPDAVRETLFNWLEDTWVAASLERGATMMRGAALLLQFLERPGRYSAETFPMLIVQIVTTDAPSVLALRPDLPTAVDEIIARALARDVRDRFQSVTELARALQPFREVSDAPRKVAVVPKTRLSLEGTLPSKRTPKLGALPERSSNVPTSIGRAGAPRAHSADAPAEDAQADAGDLEEIHRSLEGGVGALDALRLSLSCQGFSR